MTRRSCLSVLGLGEDAAPLVSFAVLHEALSGDLILQLAQIVCCFYLDIVQRFDSHSEKRREVEERVLPAVEFLSAERVRGILGHSEPPSVLAK